MFELVKEKSTMIPQTILNFNILDQSLYYDY